MLRSVSTARPALRGFLVLAVIAAAGCGSDGGEAASSETTNGNPSPMARDRGFVLENVGFATPESVLHDVEDDVYLVSNVGGGPSDKDGNGFVSRVSPQGEVLALKWIDGGSDGVTLHAPKGSAIVGGKLWIADIDTLRLFDRRTGKPAGEVPIAGATFLNDVAADGAGGVYVSDSGIRIGPGGVEQTGTDAVYRVGADGSVQRIATGRTLANPNGLAVVEDVVLMATFGGNRVFRLAAGGRGVVLAETPSGRLDGLLVGPDGRLLVSSWEGRAVYVVDGQGGRPFPIADGLPAPADIGLDAKRFRLLVPLFEDDKLVVRPL